MSAPNVLPLPLWRHQRRTGTLLVVLGILVVVLGMALMEGSHELEHVIAERNLTPSPPAPPPSTSSPATTSS